MQTFQLPSHADSFLPEGKSWKLVWNDEFDGSELDTTKWGFRRNFWGKPFPTFTDQGVVLDGESHLQLHLTEKDGEYYSPHLQTGSLTYDIPKDTPGFWPFGKYEEAKFMHRFGYYEIRCRMPRNDGWHAAFWLQSPSVGAHPDPRFGGVECDIMENYRQHQQGEIICGNLWGGYGKNGKGHGHFRFKYEETGDRWHHYAVDWSPSGYVFYADGKEVGRVAGPVSEVEQFILVSTECAGYRGPGFTAPAGHPAGTPCDLLKKAVLPDYFEVDFVRVFDQV
ncbi:MAG: glycoside hydrolase family 16 protein [Lentisphaeria bacterium]|jgi:beta-glucanase (GH16 family)|nr:glycoside hydrolase family 16 protein [Lentisphaeria bacterium]